MMRRTFAILLILGFLLLLSACNGTASGSVKPEPTEALASAAADKTADPTEEPAATTAPEQFYDDAAWFCPSQIKQQSDSPAKAINMATGEVLVACPDPLCTHSASSETCFYNFTHDNTEVYATQYLNGHIYFISEKKTEDGGSMKLYDYDIAQNRIEDIYTFEFINSSLVLFENGSRLFFSAITDVSEGGEDAEETVGLFSFDPESGKVALIDDNARYAMSGSGAAFYDEYYICEAGYDAEKDRILYSRRSYDGSFEEEIDSLPDGTPFEIFGWALKSSGLFANTWGSGGVYFPDGEIKLMFPTESATTYPVRCGDSIYFQTRSSEFTELGKDPYTGTTHKGYAYDNEIYVMNKDGSYKHYSIECEDHFVIGAAYENVIIGRIAYKIPEAGKCITDGSADIIRICLDTGETTVYDMSKRNGFIVETYVSQITLNDN